MPDDPETRARLIYLALLLAGLGFFAFAGGGRLGKNLRDLAIWSLIFIGVIVAYGFRDVLRRELFPTAMVELAGGGIELRRGADGHFHATLEVNGEPVRFLVDTGASDIVLSRADAAAVGIDVGALDFTGRALTANGMVATAPVQLDEVAFAGMVDHGVRASVNAGGLDVSLLGLAYLDRFARIEIEGDLMRLHP